MFEKASNSSLWKKVTSVSKSVSNSVSEFGTKVKKGAGKVVAAGLAIVGIGGATKASADVMTADQVTAVTGALQAGMTEYFSIFIAFATIAIPFGLILALLYKFMPRVKGRSA